MTLPQSSQHIALLTAGKDKPYAFGVTTALRAAGVRVDVVAGQELDLEVLHEDPGVNLLLLRREPAPGAGVVTKATSMLRYYAGLIAYAWSARPTVFHILWNNKFETFDRVVLMLYYRLLGKRIVFTAHNVNTADRDDKDSAFNRFTLKIQYQLCDHIFVHTDRMKAELVAGFAVPPERVTVIQFGINNSVPHTPLTTADAKLRLGLPDGDMAVLFFGNIAPYKGLEYLVDAVLRLRQLGRPCRLIIGGRPKQGFEAYWAAIKATIEQHPERAGVLVRDEFIPDEETEVYFKAADVLALPYTTIFQSGVLVLGYSFGLPVLVAAVGSLQEEVIEGRTGYSFAPQDSAALGRALEIYLESELFRNLADHRIDIQRHAEETYSWKPVARTMSGVYARAQSASTRGAAPIAASDHQS